METPGQPPPPSPELHRRPWPRDYGLGPGDRRVSFSRHQSDPSSAATPRGALERSHSSIGVPLESLPLLEAEGWGKGRVRKGDPWGLDGGSGFFPVLAAVVRAVRSGSRPMRRLALMISLNVAYSTVELAIGVFTGRIGLVSDAFHLTFGCGLLTFSLLAMAISRRKPDGAYTYGYKRVEVLAAFTNALFLLFMSFSLAVEALHAFIQDESEHKHYLIVSAGTNLLVNLLGVWFFRNYARINIVYRTSEDINHHSVCLHVLSDSIRSAGIVLASWFLTLGVENAEVLCLGLVSVTVFMMAMPLFRAAGGILLQMAPATVPQSAFSKCWRQITALEDVIEVSQARFWELVPGHVIGSLSIQVKVGSDEYPILQYVHGLYHDLGIQELTINITRENQT